MDLTQGQVWDESEVNSKFNGNQEDIKKRWVELCPLEKLGYEVLFFVLAGY